MLDLSKELQLTEKSYTFPFKDFSRFSSTKSIRTCFQDETDFGIFVDSFTFKYFFSINKQITFISIIMQALSFSSAAPKASINTKHIRFTTHYKVILGITSMR